MNMSRLILTQLVLWTAATDTSVWAQHPSDKGLPWGITLQRCHHSAQAACVFYGEQAAIEMKFGVSNAGLMAIELPPLTENVGITVIDEHSVKLDVSVEWHAAGERTVAGSDLDALDLANRNLVLGIGDSARSSLTIRRADGSAFMTGKYRIMIDIQPALEKSTTDSGTKWRGRAGGTQAWIFDIRHPETRDDWIRLHQAEARYLLGERKTSEALPHIEAWVRLSPGDRFAQTALGRAYLDLGRPAEAVRILEQALPTMLQAREPRQRQAFTLLLARSYMRLKDEVNARRVLALTSDSARAISATLEKLRQP